MQPHGKPPPGGEQSCTFILFMIYAAHLSGNMLQQLGLLMTGKELMPMSPESRQSLLRKLAEQLANLTQNQRRKLIESRFRAVLVARLLGKQSWQRAPMRISVVVLHHLMTKCIPRIRITPIRMPEYPVKQGWQLTGSVFYDPSGYIADRGNWSQYQSSIKAITSHPRQPLIAVMHSDGKVWIGRKGENLFCLIHSPNTDAENATAMEFHPRENIIAVAIRGCIMMYKISQYLKPELHFKILFHPDPGFCPSTPRSANELGWNQNGTFLTAISEGKLSKCYFLDPITLKVKGDTDYAVLRSLQEDLSPSCSCFSSDGKLAVMVYSDGILMTRSFVETEKGPSLVCSKKVRDFFPKHSINNIVSHPNKPSVFAIEVKATSSTCVLIVHVNHDGSVTITATIPDAKSPHFHDGLFFVSRKNKLLVHRMNSCNIPCLVTEFHLRNSGTFSYDIGAFFVSTTPNGEVILYYSSRCGGSKLHMAGISLN